MGQGLVYECMNMASLWKLPVIYVCENNLYNEYTHYLETTAGDLAMRAQAFGVAVVEDDGQDARVVHDAAVALVARARRKEGPAMLLLRTYRQRGHHVGDIDRAYYRTKEEERTWSEERDPLKILSRALIDEAGADAAALDRAEEEVRTEIQQGVTFALEAPYPAAAEVGMHVYA